MAQIMRQIATPVNQEIQKNPFFVLPLGAQRFMFYKENRALNAGS
jgi:hypothetical protein